MKRHFTKYSKGRNRLRFLPFLRQEWPSLLVAAILVALLATVYGNGEPIASSMVKKPFALVYFFYLLLAFVNLFMIRWFTARFDLKYTWWSHGGMRMVYQFLAGWLLPMLVIVGIAILFFTLSGADHMAESFLHADLTLLALLVVMANAGDIMVYFVFENLRWRAKVKRLVKQIAILNTALLEKDRELDKPRADAPAAANRENQEKKEMYKIYTEHKISGYHFPDIACFFVEKGSDIIFLKLMEPGKTNIGTSETSLIGIADTTGPAFKSISRHFVVGQHAINKCIKLPGGKLKLTFGPENTSEEISRENARKLEEWILEKVDIEVLKADKK